MVSPGLSSLLMALMTLEVEEGPIETEHPTEDDELTVAADEIVEAI